MRRWLVVAMLMAAALASAPAIGGSVAGDEAERLRADMEGQSERLRLTVETFLQQQDQRLGSAVAAQDRRIDDLRHSVLALSGLCGLLAILASGLAVALGRSRRPQARRRDRP